MIRVRSSRAASLSRYAEAVAAALLASALSWVFRDALADTKLLLLWVMSVVVAWRGGRGPVILASLLALTIWKFLFVHPGQLTAPAVSDLLIVILYVSASAVLGHTVDTMRQAQRAVAQAADGMLNAMFVCDRDWRLQFVNNAGLALVGRLSLDVERLRSRSVWDAMPDLRGTTFEVEAMRARSERRVLEFEDRLPGLDLWLQVRCVPTADGGVAIFARDVTAEKRAEQERIRSEARYQALVRANTMMIWSTDSAGMVNDMPIWREITGQTTAEHQGAGWVDAIHPDDRTAAADRWHDAVAQSKPYTAEYRLRQRDGSYRWFHAHAVPVLDGDEVVEWVGVFDNIQDEHLQRERHAAVEEALSVLGTSLDYEWNLEAVSRLLVPTLADYCSVDIMDANGELRRVSSTHADAAKEEVLRELWTKYPYLPDDAGAPAVVRTGIASLNAQIDPADVVKYARTPDHGAMLSQLNPRSFLCVPMRSHGQVFGALSLVYSDSGRAHTQQEQGLVEQIAARAATAIENARLYADAQAASRAKSDFLATMSHELRTPLNAIAGYAELMLLGVRGPITDEQERDLRRIRQNQQHLLEIITDILNFSRIEAGGARYDLQPCALAEVLERMEGVIEPQARSRSLRYVYVPPPAELIAMADREKVEQILINLLGNAVKFTPAGGEITLYADSDEGRIRIHVRDTGVGVPPAQLASIFEPFVQLEPALKRTKEGTGLGLAISRQLARGMGGELRAASQPGQGSLFSLDLPRALS
ncbi:MAG: ATP-binding region ATPase domain protein [Gemmatimonadetes bacterium]|nr:ATP-binding region ATPase domain protein [Gemmatimonadota bacterium]